MIQYFNMSMYFPQIPKNTSLSHLPLDPLRLPGHSRKCWGSASLLSTKFTNFASKSSRAKQSKARVGLKHSKIIRRSFEDRSKIIQICPLLFCFGFETKISQNPLKILKSSARSWNLTNMTTKPPRSFVPNSDASNSSSSVELVAKLNHAAMLRWKKKTRPLEAAMTGSLSRSWSDRSSWKGAAVVLGVTLNV